jgi:hypothetical protein
MNKIEYLNVNSTELSRRLFKSLQNCLTPEESCQFLLLNPKLDFKKKDYVLLKVKNELKNEFQQFHKVFIRELLKIVNSEKYDYITRNRTSSILYDLCSILTPKYISKIKSQLIKSRYKLIRNRAYKLILDKKELCNEDDVKKNWELFKDEYAAEIIYKYCDFKYIYEQLDELTEILEDWQVRQLYLKIIPHYPEYLERLKKTKFEDYLYTIAKTKGHISDKEAFEIFAKSTNKGFVVWALGEMHMWEVLVRIHTEKLFKNDY